jgi:BioD-like phosphotransacetylase family protein
MAFILSSSSRTTATRVRRLVPSSSTPSPASSIHINSSYSSSTGSASPFSTDSMDTSPSSSSSSSESGNSQRQRRPIFVAATRQHVGKTSVSLALISGLQKRFDKVGFIKPVGQHSVTVANDEIVDVNGTETQNSVSSRPIVAGGIDTTISVDKDAALVKQHFRLHHLKYRHTSPVIIPAGYTRDHVDGKNVASLQQKDTIQNAYQHVAASSNVVLCEGTGHVAVGSIVEASNAAVASWLDARMVLVANGGLGSTFDELDLNRTYCLEHGVEIAGVIINKVKTEKYEQTKHYLTKVLKDRWNVPLLGCVPDRPFLGCPALSDLEKLFPGSRLISGKQHRLRHYRVQDLNLVATSLEVFLQALRRNPARTLYVCHSSRNDILLGFLMEAQQRGADWEAALVVTGTHEHPLPPQTLEIVTNSCDSDEQQPPILLTPHSTTLAMEWIHNYTPKLNFEDGHRVDIAVQHYEPYINFDVLLDRVGYNNGIVSSDSDSNDSSSTASDSTVAV